MFRWFRTAAPVRETAVAMVDPRPGDALLVVGASDARLAASCAVVTGLNGRTVVVGRGAAEKKQVDVAAASAGALIEFIDAPLTTLPVDTNSFDVVTIAKLTGAADSAVVGEAIRVLRPAGRIIIITGQKRAGVWSAFQTPQAGPPAGEILTLLKSAGTVAARKLATVDGVSYFEARKPRT